MAVISALSGMAGIGKTSLAVHWARRVLVTSRNQLTGLLATDGAHPLHLSVLPHPPTSRSVSSGSSIR